MQQLLISNSSYSHRSDIESPDQLSISGTPSGVQTPRPSGTDKRLPGILHSYFGQVGTPSSATPKVQRPPVLFPSRPSMCLAPFSSLRTPELLLTAPTSPNEHDESRAVQPSSEQQGKTSTATASEHEVSSQYPTPPPSSRASSISSRRDSDESNDSVSQPRVMEVLKTSCSRFIRSDSRSDITKLRACRQTQTAIANPTPKLTANSVHAAHLSSPANISSSIGPSTPARDVSTQSALSSLTSNLELPRLTDSMDALDVKATPPITPRTLSNDGTEGNKRTTSPNDRLTGTIDSNGTSTPRSGAPVPPPKGELVVTISGARGLRPSFDPYAVCVFEWIESIAHHHKQGMLLADEGAGRGDLRVGGLPISQTSSSMGRSMAIPMKSRQGSTTSLSDQKEFKNNTEVTDPQWDHQAVLCVAKSSSSFLKC